MKYWQLKIERNLLGDEHIDLRHTPIIRAGDDTRNEVCIESIDIPSNLKLLECKGSKLRLCLTNEVSHSLKGSFRKIKDWKTRLYQGQIFEVTGPVEFQIAHSHFKISQAQTIGFVTPEIQKDALEKKHFYQSMASSAGAHLGLALFLFLIGLVFQMLQHNSQELEVQKLTVADVKEIFKDPEPVKPLIEPEPTKEVLPEPQINQTQKKKSAKRAAPKNLKTVKRSKKQDVASAKGAPKKGPRDLSKMGLLAIQTSKTTSSRSVNLTKPQIYTPTATVADANGVSAGTFGDGLRSGDQTQRIARIDGLSTGGNYEGGELGRQAQASIGPSIQLVRKEIEVKGGLDAAIIQQIIEERLSEVRYCYENLLFKKAGLSGKVSTSWTILADGSVSNTQSASSDIQEKELHNCVKERITQWKFPQPKGGGVVHVKYPFVFRSLGS